MDEGAEHPGEPGPAERADVRALFRREFGSITRTAYFVVGDWEVAPRDRAGTRPCRPYDIGRRCKEWRAREVGCAEWRFAARSGLADARRWDVRSSSSASGCAAIGIDVARRPGAILTLPAHNNARGDRIALLRRSIRHRDRVAARLQRKRGQDPPRGVVKRSRSFWERVTNDIDSHLRDELRRVADGLDLREEVALQHVKATQPTDWADFAVVASTTRLLHRSRAHPHATARRRAPACALVAGAVALPIALRDRPSDSAPVAAGQPIATGYRSTATVRVGPPPSQTPSSSQPSPTTTTQPVSVKLADPVQFALRSGLRRQGAPPGASAFRRTWGRLRRDDRRSR